MDNMQTLIKNYLEYCGKQKCLDEKTLKAYKIDLKQFSDYLCSSDITDVSTSILEDYIGELHNKYKPKTVKRKIASAKAFFHYLEYKEILDRNPFNKLQLKFREPVILPKTIPLHTVETILSTIYEQLNCAKTIYQRRNSLRDAAVIELLFATGMRISELCALKVNDINLYDGSILIYGKGDKERRLQIGNPSVISILNKYEVDFHSEIMNCNHFFANQSGRSLTDQTVRRMINKYTALAAIDLHITPHMFRHTFATRAMEQGMDAKTTSILLGHYSVSFTLDTYTHVLDSQKQEEMKVMEEFFTLPNMSQTQSYAIVVTPMLNGFLLNPIDFDDMSIEAGDLQYGIQCLKTTIIQKLVTMYPPTPTPVNEIVLQQSEFIVMINL